MSVPEDFLKSAKMFQAMAAQIEASNRAFRQMGEQLQYQTALINSVMKPEVMESVARSARLLTESLTPVSGQLVAQHGAFVESARMVAAVELKLPNLVAGYPKLLDAIGKSLPTIDDLAPMLRQLADVRIPEGVFAAGLVDDLRAAAMTQIEAIETPARETFADVMDSLVEIQEEVDNKLEEREQGTPSDSRSNVLWVCAVLSVLFQFLANQGKILETSFEDAAAVGAALAPLSHYAAAILVLLLAYRKTRGG